MFLSKELKCIKLGDEYYFGVYDGRIHTCPNKRECLGTNAVYKEVERIKAVCRKKKNRKYKDVDLTIVST